MKIPPEMIEPQPQARRLRSAELRTIAGSGDALVIGIDMPSATVAPAETTIGVVDVAPPRLAVGFASASSTPGRFEQGDRHEDEDASAVHDKLTPMDRVWVARTAALIRENVLRDVASQAEVIADVVVAKLREEPVKITEPQRFFIDAAEAAAILGISRDAFDKRVQRRQVPGVVRTAGRRIQIDKAKMLAGLAKRGR